MVALPLVVQYAYLQEVVVVTRKLQFNALLVKYLQLFRGDVILGEGCHLVVPHYSVESQVHVMHLGVAENIVVFQLLKYAFQIFGNLWQVNGLEHCYFVRETNLLFGSTSAGGLDAQRI